MDKSIGGFLGTAGLIGLAFLLRGLSGGSGPNPAVANTQNALGGDEVISCDLADARYGYRVLYNARIRRRADYLAMSFDAGQLKELREQKYQTLLMLETQFKAYDGNAGVERSPLPDGYEWLEILTEGADGVFPRQAVENDLIFDITAIGFALDSGQTDVSNVSSLKWVGGRCGDQ